MYRTILVTTDGSRMSQLAIPHATDLASATGASIVVLGVAPGPTAEAVEHVLLPLALPQEQQEMRDRVAEFETELRGHGATEVEALVARGDAADKILDEADRRNADVIVMSSTGRSGVTHALLGSVAEDVIKRSECPVLLVHGSAK